MKFSIKDFLSKWDQICRKLRIWSRLLWKSLMENLIFCEVLSAFHTLFPCYAFAWSSMIRRCFQIWLANVFKLFYNKCLIFEFVFSSLISLYILETTFSSFNQFSPDSPYAGAWNSSWTLNDSITYITFHVDYYITFHCWWSFFVLIWNCWWSFLLLIWLTEIIFPQF